jgi:hypothetical protein
VAGGAAADGAAVFGVAAGAVPVVEACPKTFDMRLASIPIVAKTTTPDENLIAINWAVRGSFWDSSGPDAYFEKAASALATQLDASAHIGKRTLC